ncbi:11491_t:CDS:1, partial [Paraglomus brasilianum]
SFGQIMLSISDDNTRPIDGYTKNGLQLVKMGDETITPTTNGACCEPVATDQRMRSNNSFPETWQALRQHRIPWL